MAWNLAGELAQVDQSQLQNALLQQVLGQRQLEQQQAQQGQNWLVKQGNAPSEPVMGMVDNPEAPSANYLKMIGGQGRSTFPLPPQQIPGQVGMRQKQLPVGNYGEYAAQQQLAEQQRAIAAAQEKRILDQAREFDVWSKPLWDSTKSLYDEDSKSAVAQAEAIIGAAERSMNPILMQRAAAMREAGIENLIGRSKEFAPSSNKMVKDFVIDNKGTVEKRALKPGGDPSNPNDWVALSSGMRPNASNSRGEFQAPAGVDEAGDMVYYSRRGGPQYKYSTKGEKVSPVGKVYPRSAALGLGETAEGDTRTPATKIADTKADISVATDLTKRAELTKTFINKIDENIGIFNQLKQPYYADWNRLAKYPAAKIDTLMGSGTRAAIQQTLNSISLELGKSETGSLGIAGVGETQAAIQRAYHDDTMPIGEIEKILTNAHDLGVAAERALDKQQEAVRKRMNSRRDPKVYRKPMSKPTLAQWLSAARKANPGVPDAELGRYYDKKYGGR
jgi:hypothetical protein